MMAVRRVSPRRQYSRPRTATDTPTMVAERGTVPDATTTISGSVVPRPVSRPMRCSPTPASRARATLLAARS